MSTSRLSICQPRAGLSTTGEVDFGDIGGSAQSFGGAGCATAGIGQAQPKSAVALRAATRAIAAGNPGMSPPNTTRCWLKGSRKDKAAQLLVAGEALSRSRFTARDLRLIRIETGRDAPHVAAQIVVPLRRRAQRRHEVRTQRSGHERKHRCIHAG
jgi:hypothetical protein